MFDPPPGYDDLEADSQHKEFSPHYTQIEVPDVGTVMARRPMPNAIHALAAAANAKLGDMERANYLGLFARNHLAEGELERIFIAQIDGDMPPDAVERVVRQISIWDTARPTVPSSI